MNLFFLIFSILFFFIPPEKKKFENNNQVIVDMTYPSKFSAKDTVVFAFRFAPIKGIHVNTTPAFELRFDKNSIFEVTGNARFGKDAKEYLDIRKPIEFFVKIKSETQPGTYPLKAKLNYFYCSDEEGWCNRFSQNIDISVEIIR